MGGRHNTTKAFNYELTASELYGAPHKLRTRTPQWLPEPDEEYRTNSRRPLDQPPGTTTETDKDGGRRRRRQTKTETVEDEDRRRRRQTKTETVEDEDRLTVGTSELAAPLQLTTPPSEHRT